MDIPIQQIIGICLLLTPFVIVSAVITKTLGFKCMLCIWGASVGMAGLVVAGVYLIKG